MAVLYLVLYVDDMLIASQDLSKIEQLKTQLKIEFEMKDIGPTTKILGMNIVRNRKNGTVEINQTEYH